MVESRLFDFLDVKVNTDALRTEAMATGIILFGAGAFARVVHQALGKQGISVKAFLVTGRQKPGVIEGIPVLSLADWRPDRLELPVWLAVFNRSAEADLGHLTALCESAGFTRVLMPQHYFELIEADLGWRYWLTDRREYAAHRREIESTYERLGDAESRRLFLEILHFRLGLPEAKPPKPTLSAQYFPEEILTLLNSRTNRPILVDGGAYDGDTLRLARRYCQPRLAYAFEPDPRNFELLAANAARFDFPVICVPCGLSSSLEWVAFSSDGGEASSICDTGTDRILTVSLDQCLPASSVDLIKLDVEGHEVSALTGAMGVIGKFRPILAIAAYHRWDDVWRLPAPLYQFQAGYRLLLRAHESNTFDSILYGIP